MFPSTARAEAQASRRLWGFTLLEVMVVLILFVVLAAAARAKISNMGQDLTATIEQLKVRIRYAQMRSINNVSVHGVTSDGSSYWMFTNGNINNRERFPGANAVTVTLPSGITMDSFTVSFDTRGVPYSDAAATAGSELAGGSAAASITVGGKAAAVRVTPNTGYIRD